MKKLGVIGGMGPLATARFLTLIVEMTQARNDQDHIEVILHSKPSIPDRTAFILGESQLNPEGDLVSIAKELAGNGAEVIAIPCFTSYYFHEAICAATGVPVLDPIADTKQHLVAAGVKKAGILATSGSIRAGFYQDALGQARIEAVLPDADMQERLMRLIYEGVKGGEADGASASARLEKLADGLCERGAEAVLLGCSELSCISLPPSGRYVDVLRVLARSSVAACRVY